MEILTDIYLPHEDGSGSRPVIVDNTGKLDALDQGADGTFLSGVGTLTIPEIETVKVSTISADTTLDNDSETNQLINPSGTYRLNLSKSSITTGKYFNIRHTGSSGSIIVRNDTTTLLTLYPLTSVSVIFDGSDWVYRRSPELNREGKDFLGFAHKAELANADRFVIEDSVSDTKRYVTYAEILEKRGINYVYKTANQTVESTTPTNDQHLALAIEASSTYLIEGELNGYTAEDNYYIKLQFSVPSGATFFGSYDIAQVGSSEIHDWKPICINADLTALVTPNILYGTTTKFHIRLKGILVVGSTAGTLQFKFGLNSLDYDSVTMEQNSFLKYTKKV
jgi:hypothetical protein